MFLGMIRKGTTGLSQAWETDALNISWEGLCVLSSGPHPSGDSKDDHQQVQNHRDCTRVTGVLGSYGSIQRVLLRFPLWVNLLTQPFSNRFHNNTLYN